MVASGRILAAGSRVRVKESIVAKTPKRSDQEPAAPAELDPAQEALFREVEEDLRAEQMRKLWKRFGPYVIGAAVLIVAIVAGFQGWTAWQASVRTAEAERYFSAAREDGVDRDALAALAAEGRTGYADLAALRRANDLARDGATAQAVDAYDAVSSDGSVPMPVRDLAAMLAALHALDLDSSAAVRGRLTPLTAEDSPWRFMARELLAVLAMRDGTGAEARTAFAALRDEREAPPGVRARAAEMLAVLGGAPEAPEPGAGSEGDAPTAPDAGGEG